MRRIIVILILFSVLLSGCISVEEPVNYIPEGYSELVPMEIEAEINKALIAEKTSVMRNHKYYGTYGDCVVWFETNNLPVVETKEIAGQKFAYISSFNLYVYRKGKVVTLEEAYKKRWLTKKQIQLLADFHAAAVGYPDGVRVYTPDSYGEKVPEYLQDYISIAWLKYWNNYPWKSDPIYYGQYSWRHVMLVPVGDSSEIHTITVNGYDFHYPGQFELVVYYFGRFTPLAKTLGFGTMTQEHIEMIYQFHKENNAALYTNTDAN